MDFQDRQRRDHGDEDTDEQLGNFRDWRVGELVEITCGFLCGFQGQERRDQDDHTFNDGAPGEDTVVIDMPALAACIFIDDSGKDYTDDDHRDEDQVVATLNAELFFCFASFQDVLRRSARGNFLIVIAFVEHTEYDQHDDHVENQDRQEMRRRPEERYVSLESHEQRRVAQRGQTSAHIGHQEDKEDDDMRFLFSPGIGTDHRTDQQHGRAGGPDPAGQYHADKQKDRVNLGRTDQGSLDRNPSGYDKQPQQQDDKRYEVNEYGLQKSEKSLSSAIFYSERDDEQCRPRECGPEHIVFPPLRFDQRDNRDGQEHPDKRDDTPQWK